MKKTCCLLTKTLYQQFDWFPNIKSNSVSFNLNTGLTTITDLFWLSRSILKGSRHLPPPDPNSINSLVSRMIKNKQTENTLFCTIQYL